MQVWFKNRLVGEAKVGRPSPGMREIKMYTVNDRPLLRPATSMSDLPAPDMDLLRLPLDTMNFEVSDKDLMIHGDQFVFKALAERGVSEVDCDIIQSYNRCSKIYRYKIIRVTLSLLETIFDMPWFEPDDGEFDPIYRQSMNHMIAHSISTGF